MRGLSTILGAMIALIALTVAISSLAYYALEASKVSLVTARDTESRIVEQIYLRDTQIEANATTVCFTHEIHDMIRSVILVFGRHIHVFDKKCIPKTLLVSAKELILVSKHGALLPVPDPKRLVEVQGVISINSLLNGLVGRGRSANQAPATPLQLNTVSLPHMYNTSNVYMVYYIVKSEKYHLSTYMAGAGSTPVKLEGYINLTKPYNDIICYHVLIPIPNYYINGVGTAIICVTRTVIHGNNIIIPGTLGYIDSPLIGEIVRRAASQHLVHVILGAPRDVVAYAEDKIYHPSDVHTPYSVLPVYESDTATLYALPVIYKPMLRGLNGNVFRLSILYRLALDSSNIAIIMTPIYAVNVFSALALIARDLSGLTSAPVTTNIKLIYGNIDQYHLDISYSFMTINILTNDAVNLFTYYNITGATCKLVRLDASRAPVYLDRRLGFGLIPGLVCIESEAEPHKTRVFDVQFTLYEVYRVRDYRVVLDCYYPYVLVCNGTIEVYYSLAPSILYDMISDKTLNYIESPRRSKYYIWWVREIVENIEKNLIQNTRLYVGETQDYMNLTSYVYTMLPHLMIQWKRADALRLLSHTKDSDILLVCNGNKTLAFKTANLSLAELNKILSQSGCYSIAAVAQILKLPGITIMLDFVKSDVRMVKQRIPVYDDLGKLLENLARLIGYNINNS